MLEHVDSTSIAASPDTVYDAACALDWLDPKIVVPMPVCDDEADCQDAMGKFLHEMGAEPTIQPRLSVTASGLPSETTTVLLESRGKA